MGTKVKLLRPLDGKHVGHVAEYPDDDAKDLERRGIVVFHDEKAAPEAQNKMAPEVVNKATPINSRKGA